MNELLAFLRLSCVTTKSALDELERLLIVDLDATLEGIPVLPAEGCLGLFLRLERDTLPASAPERTIAGVEKQSVQAFVALLLSDMLSALGDQYKVLSEKVPPPLTGRPDHVIVRSRDAFVDLANTLVLVEDKAREEGVAETVVVDNVGRGTLDAVGYAITRAEYLWKLFPQADGVRTAFSVFTNGLSVRIFRVTITCEGLKKTGRVLATPLLPLFSSGAARAAAPAGFEALARLLAATPEQLQDAALPPSTLRCVLAGVQLQLGERLGVGGFSNVYACEFEGQPAVAKCAFINERTPLARANLLDEADTLRLLNDAHCPAVPRLLAQGDPVNDAVPFLVIAPRGEPLCMFATTAADPRALAADVAHRVLLALRGAHAAGRLHGDVRPSNVVMEDGKALLVDWGVSLSLNKGAMRKGPIGTLAFASQAVSCSFDDRAAPWFADASVDLESVAYLYAAVALASDEGCTPLWNYAPPARRGGPMPPLDLLQGPRSAAVACAARARWLEEHRTELGEGVFDFLRRVGSGETPYDASF